MTLLWPICTRLCPWMPSLIQSPSLPSSLCVIPLRAARAAAAVAARRARAWVGRGRAPQHGCRAASHGRAITAATPPGPPSLLLLCVSRA